MSQTYASASPSKQDDIPAVRRILLAVLFIGLLGTATDLALLSHFEDPLQLTPLVLLGLGLVLLVWHVINRGRGSVRALQVLMILFVIGGLAGLVLHYRGSMEFQLEVNPELSGLELFLKAIRAKAPPALGPGAMIHLGLLGLAYAYRYPASGSSPSEKISATGV
jgi:hypothetical protein